ncbi:hypothetical protein GCM10018787_54350 [Streptomyces thermodiastaticus]|nr:hypothetical protein GCM10018787_54350 [Streptomyces thermodiastaticus]
MPWEDPYCAEGNNCYRPLVDSKEALTADPKNAPWYGVLIDRKFHFEDKRPLWHSQSS